MELLTLRNTLINFAGDPNKAWGQPTNGWGESANVNVGTISRVPVELADRNAARYASGTYTPAQLVDFEQQLAQIEKGNLTTAIFPGDPHRLPDTLPELPCPQCSRPFRSKYNDEPDTRIACYDCAIDHMCPPLPFRNIRCFWDRDDWHMEAFGMVGVRNELTFWWHNRNSGGNTGHQGLFVQRNREGEIVHMRFSTVAMSAHRCYVISFNLLANTTTFALRSRASVSEGDTYGKTTQLEELDPIVLDLAVAMLPTWMLYEHRPRNPANGCFAVA